PTTVPAPRAGSGRRADRQPRPGARRGNHQLAARHQHRSWNHAAGQPPRRGHRAGAVPTRDRAATWPHRVRRAAERLETRGPRRPLRTRTRTRTHLMAAAPVRTAERGSLPELALREAIRVRPRYGRSFVRRSIAVAALLATG